VHEFIWVFARGQERLTLQRRQSAEGMVLVIDDGAMPRSYPFQDEVALIAFQTDMEGMLLQTGWLLEAFEPEQRAGRDRRSWPRLANDRRRWWTDGLADRRRGWLVKGAAWLSDRMTSRSR
jgi:hypothetical protein